jgi:TldD protein
MKRRDFVKVTLKGSAVVLGGPTIFSLLGGGRASALGATQLDDPGLEESMLRILRTAVSRGARYADVYLEEVLRTGISLVDGKVESVEYGVHRGGGVRVISNWKTGYAFCDSWDEADLDKVAEIASRISRETGSPDIVMPTWRQGSAAVSFEIAPDEIDSCRKVEVATLADSAARAYDPAIKQVRVNYSDEIKRMVVCNSEGVIVRQEVPLIWLTLNTLAERGSKKSPGYLRRSKKHGFEYVTTDFVEETAREASRQAMDMLEAREAPGGEVPVVIGSGGGVVFHEAVGHGLEADGVEKQTSFFTGKVGTRVGSELVTIVDDGSIANLRGSFDFDDEGTPSQRNVLIENGVLRGYMYDLLTAWKLKARPTGNGRRESYMHYPLVRMTNTLLVPGEAEPGDIIASTPSGIYTRHLGGGEVDTTTGNFTFGIREAYLIEGGRLTAPIKGATLIGNGPEILNRIDMVGNDQAFWPGTCGKGQWVPVSSGAPTLRISSITVGGRG